MEIEEAHPPSTSAEGGGTLSNPNCTYELLSLSPEILHLIALWLGRISFPDLAALAASGREMKYLIYEDPDTALWRELHSDLYDDPRPGGHKADKLETSKVKWREEVINRWRAKKILEKRQVSNETNKDAPCKADEVDLVGTTLLGLYDSIPVAADSPSLNAAFLESMLSSKGFQSLYQASMIPPLGHYRLRSHSSSNSETVRLRKTINHPDSKLSHLHVLVGWYNETQEQLRERTMGARMQYLSELGLHRRITYSIKNFNLLNDFGPFHPDGTVRWSVVDSIAQVMDANITYVSGKSVYKGHPARRWESNEWRSIRAPSNEGINAVRGTGLRGLGEEEKKADWAGVSGTHKGTYAFMDYTDWIQSNYSNLDIIPQQVAVDLDSYLEATGNVMCMQLTTDISPAVARLPPLVSTIPICNDIPPLPFCGKSFNGASNEGTSVRGNVYVTPDNELRWSWVVSYGGGDRWRLEGVQIGGRGSSRGIIGVWSDAERAELSPVGPFMYWPVDDEEEDVAAAGVVTVSGDLLDSDSDDTDFVPDEAESDENVEDDDDDAMEGVA